MDFKFTRKTIMAHPTFSVFALTAFSYAIAFLYEQSRRTAFEVLIPITSVGIDSLIIAALFLITASTALYVLDDYLDRVVRKKIEDELSAIYILNRVRRLCVAAFLALTYLILPAITDIPQDSSSLPTKQLLPYITSVAFLMTIYCAVRLLKTMALYLFMKDKKGYLTYLQAYVHKLYADSTPSLVRSFTWIIVSFLLLGFPVIMGASAPFTTNKYNIVKSKNHQYLQVVIDTIGSDLIIKEYNNKTHTFTSGYSVASIEGKEFYSLKLKSTHGSR